MHIAVIDIGKPGKNLGWYMKGPAGPKGDGDLDSCIRELVAAQKAGPLALGFEAPMFVPMRADPARLLAARSGDCIPGINRPFSASAGASVLVAALVVVPYVLERLRHAAPSAVASLNWRSPLVENTVLFFEAFVTNQKSSDAGRHIADAKKAVEAFEMGMREPAKFESDVMEPVSFNLLGAMLLRTGWLADASVLAEPCLVVRAGH